MEGYKPLGTQWDRNMRFEEDRMYQELYNGVTNIIDDISEEAFKKVVDSAKMNWKSPVDDFSNLPTDALEGDIRMVRAGDSAGKVYRYNGIEWMEIQEIDVNPINEVESRLSEEIEQKSTVQLGSITVRVPSEYQSVNAAIDEFSKRKPMRGVIIDILLETGYEFTHQVNLSNGDFSHFRISSEDAEVPLASSFSKQDFMRLYNCRAPILNCLINARGLCTNGIIVYRTSTMVVNPGCGLKFAGHNNILVRYASTLYADYTIFTDGSQDGNNQSGHSGITAWGSYVYAYGADVSRSGTYGLRAAHGGTVHFQNGIANDCARHGIRASNAGFLDARGVKANNAGVHGIYALAGSTINAYEAEAKNAGNTGVFANQASTIDARKVNTDGSFIGVFADQASRINFFEGSALDCSEYGVYATRLSDINARSASISNALKGVFAEEGSNVNCRLSSISGCRYNSIHADTGATVIADVAVIKDTQPTSSSAHGVLSERLSKVCITGASVTNSGGNDLRVNTGGIIEANGTKTTSSTTTTPRIEDVNLGEFNIWNRLGIIFN